MTMLAGSSESEDLARSGVSTGRDPKSHEALNWIEAVAESDDRWREVSWSLFVASGDYRNPRPAVIVQGDAFLLHRLPRRLLSRPSQSQRSSAKSLARSNEVAMASTRTDQCFARGH